MNTLRDIQYGGDGSALDSGFDAHANWHALVQRRQEQVIIDHKGLEFVVPKEWSSVERIGTIAEDCVALWPITEAGSPGHLGILTGESSIVLPADFPLEVFGDCGFVACAYSEDRIVEKSDLANHDILSIFSLEPPRKIARFIELFLERFPKEEVWEIVDGVLDGSTRNFWFTAYRSSRIWCLNFEDVASIRLDACESGCPMQDAVAITCSGEAATLVVYKDRELICHSYSKTIDGLMRAAEFGVSATSELRAYCDRLIEVRKSASSMYLSPVRGRLRGLRGNMLSLVMPDRAMLFEL